MLQVCAAVPVDICEMLEGELSSFSPIAYYAYLCCMHFEHHKKLNVIGVSVQVCNMSDIYLPFLPCSFVWKIGHFLGL